MRNLILVNLYPLIFAKTKNPILLFLANICKQPEKKNHLWSLVMLAVLTKKEKKGESDF